MEQLQIPPLNEGEIYVGTIGDQKGAVYHLILLSGDNDDASQKKQIAWAKSVGGELPTKIEAAMLYERCRDQFKGAWYWTATDYPHLKGYAFVQSFDYGIQHYGHEDYDYRARAVRRLPI